MSTSALEDMKTMAERDTDLAVKLCEAHSAEEIKAISETYQKALSAEEAEALFAGLEKAKSGSTDELEDEDLDQVSGGSTTAFVVAFTVGVAIYKAYQYFKYKKTHK